MSKPVVVSATMPKQKTFGHPKYTKPKVSQAKALTKKVVPGKGKATTIKTFVITVQVHNNGGSAKTSELNSWWCLRKRLK